MRNLRIILTLRMLLQAAVAVSLLLNLSIFLGGVVFAGIGESAQTDSPSETVVMLQEQLDALEALAQETTSITDQEAETRALSLFILAEVDHGVQIWSLNNESRRDTIGREDVRIFATALELRGPRDNILAVLRELPMTFQGNLLIDQINVRGASDAWNIRFSLRQIIQ